MNFQNFIPANIHIVSKHVTITIKSFDKKKMQKITFPWVLVSRAVVAVGR